MKKILVLGGTGAMGPYAVKELLNKGYKVDAICLDEVKSDNPNVRYWVADAKDRRYIKNLLETEKYDGILDFMIYRTPEFAERFEMFLENTEHYIYLSSYRVYANEDEVITEESPRLLDTSNDKEFLASEDYSLYKARCENILNASKYNNWTIVRPAITYSENRYQIVTLEANATIARMLQGKKIVLPKEAKDVEATMSYAGDLGKMYAGIMLNPKAFRQTYTLATAEHNTWGYVADCYSEILGAKFEWIDKEDYLKIIGVGEIQAWNRWQLEYDRLFDRRIDNSKILEISGLKQEDLTPLKDGLKKVLGNVDLKAAYKEGLFDKYMDEYLENN